jgi:hypothetical protein
VFPLFATGVIDTNGKFAAGVDTRCKLLPVLLTPVENLTLMTLMLLSEAWGRRFTKKPEAKILLTLSL